MAILALKIYYKSQNLDYNTDGHGYIDRAVDVDYEFIYYTLCNTYAKPPSGCYTHFQCAQSKNTNIINIIRHMNILRYNKETYTYIRVHTLHNIYCRIIILYNIYDVNTFPFLRNRNSSRPTNFRQSLGGATTTTTRSVGGSRRGHKGAVRIVPHSPTDGNAAIPLHTFRRRRLYTWHWYLTANGCYGRLSDRRGRDRIAELARGRPVGDGRRREEGPQRGDWIRF